MKVLFSVALLLLCVGRVKAVTIESCPPANGNLLRTAVEETVTLTCTSGDPSGQHELQWFRNSAQVQLVEKSFSNASICVHPVTKQDNGAVFTCQLKGDASVNSSIELDVQYPPVLNDTEEVFVEEKTEAVLSCDVRANPPVTVVWMKDGEILDLSSGSYRSTNNGITAQLSISKAKREVHQGTYVCEVNSAVYGSDKRTFHVKVDEKVFTFPLGPTIAGVVVVACTILLALISRRNKIAKCFKRN